MSIFDQAHPKMIETISSFPEYARNQFIPFIHSWDKVNFRVSWLDWPHPILTMPTQFFFDNFKFMWICINMQKNQAISLIYSEDIAD